jgi:hypothetical protein
MTFASTFEDAAVMMYLLQKFRSEIKEKQNEEELLVRELSTIISKPHSSKKKIFQFLLHSLLLYLKM